MLFSTSTSTSSTFNFVQQCIQISTRINSSMYIRTSAFVSFETYPIFTHKKRQESIPVGCVPSAAWRSLLPCMSPATHTPLAMHAPLLCMPCMPPATYAPAMHTSLPCMPPAMHAPHHAHPLPCTPPVNRMTDRQV